MGNESKTLRDLLGGVISGTTINTLTTTATDLIRAVTDTTGNYLNISIGGASAIFPGDVSITGNLYVTGNTYEVDQYVVDDLSVNGDITVNSSSGTSGWFPVGTSGDGVSLASGIVTYMSWPTVLDGSSGTSGENGTSGTSGEAGTSGTSGDSGTSGTSGDSGTSGTSGENGTSGTSGDSGTSGTSGESGTSGTSGDSGTSGTSGENGTSGTSGDSGTSGTSGDNGTSGTSGENGISIYNVINISGDTTGVTMNYYRYSGETSYIYFPSATASGEWIIIKDLYGDITAVGYNTDIIDGNSTKPITVGQSYTFIDSESGIWDII